MRPVVLALALTIASVAPAVGKPVTYAPPPETARLAPGQGVELAEANCSACHSLDYITTQPRKLANPRAFWTAEVKKMRNAYGMQMSDADADGILDYLARTYD